MKYLITSLSLGDILEEQIQWVVLTRGGRDQIGSGGNCPGMGSLGWFQVVSSTTCWVIVIVIRMIPSRTAFLMTYEAAIFTHVASSLDWG